MSTVQQTPDTSVDTTASAAANTGIFAADLTVDEQIEVFRRTLDGIDDQRRRLEQTIATLETWKSEPRHGLAATQV